MTPSPAPPSRQLFRELYLEYFEHWNAERFWEAHESLERLWKMTSDRNKLFLQGLIQATGAFHHIQKSRRDPAIILFNQSLSYLGAYEPSGAWEGLDVRRFADTLRTWRGLVSERPRESFSPEGFPAYPKAKLEPAYLAEA